MLHNFISFVFAPTEGVFGVAISVEVEIENILFSPLGTLKFINITVLVDTKCLG